MRTVKETWGLITAHCLGNELGTQESGEEMLIVFHWAIGQCLTYASILLVSF